MAEETTHEWQPKGKGKGKMNPLPAPKVPGKTEFERFDNAVRQVFTISKEELLRREAREKRARERNKRAKKS